MILMAWEKLVAIIRAESSDSADKLVARIERELRGLRITVPSKARLADAKVQAALRNNGYNVKRAAEALGVNPATVYRALRPKRQQKQLAPHGMYNGRLVR